MVIAKCVLLSLLSFFREKQCISLFFSDFRCVKYLPFVMGIWSSVVLAEQVEVIDQTRCQLMQMQGVINDTSPVTCDRLRLVTFSYVDFQGEYHKNGEVVVLDAVAEQVAGIFDSLLKLGFPIHQAKTMEHFKGNDDDSMAANNTSAFISRAITGQASMASIHAYGLALDINPVQNPYIHFSDDGSAAFKPAMATAHANRANHRWGKPFRQGLAEQVIDIFARHGFAYWGGYWDTPIDYQHFQTSREMAEFMASVPYPLARQFFQQYVAYYRVCEKAYSLQYQQRKFNDFTQRIKEAFEGESLLAIYRSQPEALQQFIEQPVTASSSCVQSQAAN